MTVDLRYGVIFGKGDSSDWFDWEIELTPEEEIAYNNAVENELLLDDVEELQGALQRAYEEIEEEEIRNGLDFDIEYVQECQGEVEMDAVELNDLVHKRDAHALEFFGLTNADDDIIKKWDARTLSERPLIKDFVENFEPTSPYDHGWYLNVEFVDPNE